MIPGTDEKNSELEVILNAICYIRVLVDELRPIVTEHLMKAAENTEISKTIFQESNGNNRDKFQNEFSKHMESSKVVVLCISKNRILITENLEPVHYNLVQNLK